MELVDVLDLYGQKFWDFESYRAKPALVKYPAVMVAPMQEVLMRDILKEDLTIQNLLDPFVGSATTLAIGRALGLDVTGIDINPLAILISQVRLEGVPQDYIGEHVESLFSRIKILLGNVRPFLFDGIDKWFREDVIESLSLIRAAIIDEEEPRIRRFFWCCFADVVKKYSNTRTSTFKLHIKESGKIRSMANSSVEDFRNQVLFQCREFPEESSRDKVRLELGDSIDVLSKFGESSVDLIVTSPPYGDNHTTVTYGQFSILPLLWIDRRDLTILDDEMLKKHTAIDSASLGGKIGKQIFCDESIDGYRSLLSGVGEEKQKKVISFWYDYELVFAQMCRVLKTGKRLVLTLGNRRVDNVILPFDKLNDDLASKYGLKVEKTISRNIVGKRMPKRVSNVVNHGSVESMSKEYVKIYRKR